jgi:predicted transcriptional regulator
VAQQADPLVLTSEIVASYVGRNAMPHTDVPDFIASVHEALRKTRAAEAPTLPSGEAPPRIARVEGGERPTPAVDVNKSVTQDYIVCLEDGARLKMLKRYIRTHFGLTPEEYRRKWGLPDDYPMTAPGYSKVRSRLARDMGLGAKSRLGRR